MRDKDNRLPLITQFPDHPVELPGFGSGEARSRSSMMMSLASRASARKISTFCWSPMLSELTFMSGCRFKSPASNQLRIAAPKRTLDQNACAMILKSEEHFRMTDWRVVEQAPVER